MQGSLIKKWFLGVSFVISGQVLFAQQDMQYSQYLFNYLVVNPAYAGYKEAINLQAFSRIQWAGTNGAPNIYSLSADGSAGTNNSVGWGAQIVDEKRGLSSMLSAFGSYAFRIRLNPRGDRLSLGLSAGVSQWQFDRSGANTSDGSSDPYIDNFKPEWRPDFRVGAYYNTPFFYAGISATNLFANFDAQVKIPHMYVSAGGYISLTDKIGLKPSFIYREDFKGPGNIDVNLLALLMKELWVGVTYRTGIYLGKSVDLEGLETSQVTNAVSFMFELFVIKNMQIGYSYDLMTMKGWPGTHEISLSYTIQKKKTRQLTPRYF
jgi:type IX secretion system PorP/SprF family membrane protein